jgi:hypothetical protein
MPVAITLIHNIDLFTKSSLANARVPRRWFISLPESRRNGKRIRRIVEKIIAYSLQNDKSEKCVHVVHPKQRAQVLTY